VRGRSKDETRLASEREFEGTQEGIGTEQDRYSGSYTRFFIVGLYILLHYRSKDEKIKRTQAETPSEASENSLER
jgi:hypothetical protein